MVNRGTEIKLNNTNNFNIVFGTMNKNKPKTLYIKINGWANPINNYNIDYGNVIKRLNKKIKSTLYKDINTLKFDRNKSIVFLDMRESGVIYGKTSYFNCEITLTQNNYHLLTSEIMSSELSKITKHLISTIFENNEHFVFYKNKRDAKKRLIKPIYKE